MTKKEKEELKKYYDVYHTEELDEKPNNDGKLHLGGGNFMMSCPDLDYYEKGEDNWN